ncbi:exodeoxyribonuclease VII large subunit [Entomoplasma freundtii]|uniref:Exodeoxyribonuclease 7 large subunit n=1 Tax=Entomoplasma freundtii TaxID=74700 RepID=A0A2K8NRC0_9MOLU|nr:exodeoxyribonuclease VII large subunit [Entomoplasma freundtii]ATZ16337.1 exodeoxyribonuclease VII large subunit [Entomoplasma freundtii]TDY56624.1 exodeoxyribonuclease VII large subunit [Entomoplasma freundtii]
MANQVFTVSTLNKLIKEYIEAPEYFRTLFVQGEISNLTFNRSGHVYFSIKDEKASLKCMVWKDKAELIHRWKLKEGMKITCFGRLTYYIMGGSIGFDVQDVTLEGKGELQQLYEERYHYLETRGWFDKSLKKPIPSIPRRIGIVTADTGAVIHDLLATIGRRFPLIEVFLFPVQVQGTQARYDVAKKISQANAFLPQLDIIIVARGGGSYEDLWTFNEMEVLEAVRKASIPTISAIGHEPDFTLIDYVSDLRAPTPTAAAELVTPSRDELQQNLLWLKQEWSRTILELIAAKSKWLQTASNFLSQSLNQGLNLSQQTLANLYNLNLTKMDLILNLKASELEQLTLQWNLVNPYNPLEQGYALMLNQSQMVITNIRTLKIGDKINLKAQEGLVETQVRRIILNSENN